MPSFLDLWNNIRARGTSVPRFARVAEDHVLTSIRGPDPIMPNRHYFGIVVDELFIANSRRWQNEYDPMVLAVTEFTHACRGIVLPFVIGPKLLGNNASLVPQGMLYRQTRVAGVHPFRGGRIISTVVLCELRRQDHARQLLKFVEAVATAVPFAGELSTYTKYAGSILDGIDTLLGLGETNPIVGIRQEFDHDLGDPIRPSFFALIDGPEDRFPLTRLWVRDGSLLIGDSRDKLTEVRDASYALFSTRGAAELSDMDVLPVHSAAESVIQLAASPDGADWQRAKAELVVLLRELLTSPDLTHEQASQYHTQVTQQALEAHARATSINNLSAEAVSPLDNELRNSVRLLDLP
jgi:hypothetical protein